MTYSPLLVVHIAGGIIATFFGFAALLVRKGSPLHRRAGNVFVISMMCMAASGAYLALMKSQRFNILAGTLTFYLVCTAWVTVARRREQTRRLELGLLFLALFAGTISWIFSAQATTRGNAAGYFVFGLIAFLCSAGDLRMLLRGGIAAAQRLARHLWRMGFALFVAAGSFFLGTAGDPVMRRSGLRASLFTPEIRRTHLPQVPVILIVLLTLFWLWRVLFTNLYKKPEQREA
jgi:uncharacterized membrane protein